MKWSPWSFIKFSQPISFMEMCQDQFWEFVYGYWGLKGRGWFSPATEWDSWTIFTIYRIAFALPRKSSRIGRLFTHKNNCGSAISVTETSCAALIFEVEHRILDRFCVIHWCTVNTYSRAQNNFQAKARHFDWPNKFYLNRVLFSICERDFIFSRRQNSRFTDEGLVIFFSRIRVCINGQYDQWVTFVAGQIAILAGHCWLAVILIPAIRPITEVNIHLGIQEWGLEFSVLNPFGEPRWHDEWCAWTTLGHCGPLLSILYQIVFYGTRYSVN